MIKKGSDVKILTGKDKNKTGEVIEVDRINDRIKVKGTNMIKKDPGLLVFSSEYLLRMIFSDHYSGAGVCAATRAVFITGIHTGKNHIRGNSEWAERGDVWSFKAMLDDPSLEGQRPLLDTTRTVAHIFKSQGYKTGMVGKWGLGAPNTNSIPNKMGFDFFYGYNCQRQAHTYYPTHLWKNQKREFLNNYIIDKKQNLSEGLDPMDPDNYEDYFQEDYAPTLMLNQALNFIEKNKNDNFFLYYASITVSYTHLTLPTNREV